MTLNFEWDEEKAKANFKKHEVSFLEAATVFSDPLSLFIEYDRLITECDLNPKPTI